MLTFSLRLFSRSYPHFQNLGIRSNYISQVLTINQETLFVQCSKQCYLYSSLFQLSLASISLVFSCCVSVFLGSLPYLILSPAPVVVHKLSKHNEEEQN